MRTKVLTGPRGPLLPFVGVVVVLSPLVAACGSGAEGDDSTGETVTLYLSQSQEPLDGLVAGFKKAHPDVPIRVFNGDSGEASARLDAEHEAGKTVASLTCTSQQSWFTENGDRLAPLEGDWFDALPEQAKVSDSIVRSSAQVAKPVYNTDIVTGTPETWEDLLSTDYRGQVGVIDPQGTEAFLQWYLGVEEGVEDGTLPSDFVERLTDLEPKAYQSGLPLAQAVASGELAWGTTGWSTDLPALIDAGAPIAALDFYPLYTAGFWCAILKDAPNPDAADVFMEYLMSEEGQRTQTSDADGNAIGASFAYPDLEPSVVLPEDVTVIYDLTTEVAPRKDELAGMVDSILGR